MQKLLTSFGLDEAMLTALYKASNPVTAERETLLNVAEKKILRFIGASAWDPRTLSEKISAGLSAVYEWFRKKLGGKAAGALDVTEGFIINSTQRDFEEIIKEYADKKAGQGDHGIKSAQLTEYLGKPYRQRKEEYTTGLTDDAKKQSRCGALDSSIYCAIREVHSMGFIDVNFPMSAVKVKDGVVFFPDYAKGGRGDLDKKPSMLEAMSEASAMAGTF
jgi:hypothetical protein